MELYEKELFLFFSVIFSISNKYQGGKYMRHEIEEKIKNSLLLEMAVEYSGNYSGFVEKFEKLETLEEVAKEYCNEKTTSERRNAYEKWSAIYPGNDETLADLFCINLQSGKLKIFRYGVNYMGAVKIFHMVADTIETVYLSVHYQALVRVAGEANVFPPEEIDGKNLLAFVCSEEESEQYKLSYYIKMKNGYFLNEWVPVTTGRYPEDNVKVQITYIAHNSGKPMCDAFAVRYKNKWYWDDGEEVHIETVPITAWRYNDDAFGL